jgi:phytoene dehydrogenase-like protein
MTDYDAVIIGAGAGGLIAAACLVNAGKSVLIVDDHDRVGGRATSYEVDGFIINAGAIALKMGGTLEQIFQDTGAVYDVREPQPRTAFRVNAKIVNAGKGGLGILLSGLTKTAAKIGSKFAEARHGNLPEAKLSTKDWLNGLTKNKTVHSLFRNLCAVLFSANPEDLPARAFLSFFGKNASTPIGFCPRGTIGIWNDLADAIRAKGGEIRLETKATRIVIDEGIATAVVVETGGVQSTVTARAVISDAGVTATIALVGEAAMGADYLSVAAQTIRPTTMLNIYLASQSAILETAALITLGNTDSLCLVGDLTATCPELAPPGWHLYVAYSVPKNSAEPLDPQAEINHALAELRTEYPAFADAKLLVATPMFGNWPAARTCPGYNMPQETPIKNLWNVGDSVIAYGDGGTQACAETGKRAAEMAVGYIGG